MKRRHGVPAIFVGASSSFILCKISKRPSRLIQVFIFLFFNNTIITCVRHVFKHSSSSSKKLRYIEMKYTLRINTLKIKFVLFLYSFKSFFLVNAKKIKRRFCIGERCTPRNGGAIDPPSGFCYIGPCARKMRLIPHVGANQNIRSFFIYPAANQASESRLCPLKHSKVLYTFIYSIGQL